jgi:hypothetical protein
LLLPALYSLPAKVVKDGAPIGLNYSRLISAYCFQDSNAGKYGYIAATSGTSMIAP